MNKKDIIIVLLVIVTVISLLFGFFSYQKDSSKTITIYQKVCDLDNIRNSEAVQVGDISIKLTDFFFNGQYPEDLENVSDREKAENSCSQRLKFSSMSEIQSVLYDWIIYDNNNTILSTNLINIEKDTIKHLLEERGIDVSINALLSAHGVRETIIDTDNPVSKEMTSKIYIASEENKYNVDFEKIHVLIINPSYQLYGNSEYIELKDTIIEFIVNK